MYTEKIFDYLMKEHGVKLVERLYLEEDIRDEVVRINVNEYDDSEEETYFHVIFDGCSFENFEVVGGSNVTVFVSNDCIGNVIVSGGAYMYGNTEGDDTSFCDCFFCHCHDQMEN